MLAAVKKALAARLREDGFTGRWTRFRLRRGEKRYALVLFRIRPTLTSGPLRPSFYVETGVFRDGDEPSTEDVRAGLVRFFAPSGMPWRDQFEFAEDLVSPELIARFADQTVTAILEQGNLIWPFFRSWELETFQHPAVAAHSSERMRRWHFELTVLERAWTAGTATKPREEVIRTLYGYRRALPKARR